MLAEAGFSIADCAALADWKRGRDGVAVILGAAADPALKDLSGFAGDHPHIPVVVVLREISLADYANAIRSGATAALGEDEPTEALVWVVQAALQDRVSVPLTVMQSMAARIPAAPDADAWIVPHEAEWLRGLAAGTTVAGLAESAGYSERELFRMLHELYVRIGVGNRTEAIIWATRHGLLDDGSSEPPD